MAAQQHTGALTVAASRRREGDPLWRVTCKVAACLYRLPGGEPTNL
jgi:hypothetical protein